MKKKKKKQKKRQKNKENILQKGIELLQGGDIEGAKEIFRSILEETPQHSAAHLWMGNCAVLQGQLNTARKHFRQALQGDDPSLSQEAKRQLKSLWFNQIVQFLLLKPPLLYLLTAAVAGYVISMGLRLTGYEKASHYAEFLAIKVILPFFFIWAIFIISSFIGHLAFTPTSPPSAKKSARLAIALAALAVIPANIFQSYGTNIQILAIGTNIFLISIAIERLINWVGKKIAGKESPLIFRQIYRPPYGPN